ncbi:MAG: putative Nudix hydrolase YfcD [Parcubacteria bacterium C7867-006]|nr:MAG: putative Nudix hydrolase YfcD [Parcubacteria bacterium C7867-006]
MIEEYLDILNEDGSPTGESLTYKEVHKRGLLHRTARVWFVNSKGEVLVQKRSMNKKIFPGLWDAGVGGHVSSGETSVEGAQKETREEIGLDIPKEEYQLVFTVRARVMKHFDDFIDNEINDVYVVRRDLDISNLKIEKNEVDEVRWLDLETFENWTRTDVRMFADHDEEYSKLIQYLNDN